MQLQLNSAICETVAVAWLNQTIAELDTILKTNGVTASEPREEILGSFFMHLATELDHCPVEGIEVDGCEYRPVLGFMDESSKPVTLHVSKAYDLHDYAYGIVIDLLEEEGR